MPEPIRLPAAAPDLTLPLPPGAGLPEVLATVSALDAVLARNERLVADMRERLSTLIANQLQDFDPDVTADGWHTVFVLPLLSSHPTLSEDFAHRLGEFSDACGAAALLLADFASVHERVEALEQRQAALHQTLERGFIDVAEAEWWRRHP
jgi:uncharacterized coiled-coil protein SlyX